MSRKDFKEKNERKTELLEICSAVDKETLKLVDPLIDQLIFLENQLSYLKTLPLILVKEDDNTKQKLTPAYKQYKDLSQTYINALKVINQTIGIDSETVESPLRAYMEKRLQAKDE